MTAGASVIYRRPHGLVMDIYTLQKFQFISYDYNVWQ
jgi:hypothetical protein